MNFIETEIEGLYIIEPKVFNDDRGYFFESFRDDKISENIINTTFIQDNESMSVKGVLRGLHYQLPPMSQTKLVRVILGEVYDVAVDIRKGSPTFGKHVGVLLTSQNKLQFLIPRGFAHGFVVLSNNAIFSYKCDKYYSPQHERSIKFNDTALNINWQLNDSELILSDKDKNAKAFADAELFDFNTNLY